MRVSVFAPNPRKLLPKQVEKSYNRRRRFTGRTGGDKVKGRRVGLNGDKLDSGLVKAANGTRRQGNTNSGVAITHAHPDHCWGLVDDNGNRLYPSAKIAISAIDYDYWTDLSHILEAPHMEEFFRGAHYNLLPYRDRLIFVEDGKQVVPGITARTQRLDIVQVTTSTQSRVATRR